MDIKDILDKLVGHTDITCESHYDEKSLENMEMLDRIMDWACKRLRENAEWYRDNRTSARNISGYTLGIIREYIDELSDCLPDSDCESEVEE